MRYANSAHVISYVRKALQESSANNILSSSINLLGQYGDQTDISLLKEFLGHPEWYVRLQAVGAIGNLGTREEVNELVQLLQDEVWWVRYRAAQALAGMSFLTREDLEKIAQLQVDRNAREVMEQVIAES